MEFLNSILGTFFFFFLTVHVFLYRISFNLLNYHLCTKVFMIYNCGSNTSFLNPTAYLICLLWVSQKLLKFIMSTTETMADTPIAKSPPFLLNLVVSFTHSSIPLKQHRRNSHHIHFLLILFNIFLMLLKEAHLNGMAYRLPVPF